MAANSRKTKHKDTKTAVGYVRVSTAGQAAEGISLSAQKAKIRAWADLNDYELLSIHSDEGISLLLLGVVGLYRGDIICS